VGSEGVKPSPHRVKAGHASLHFDPVLLPLRPFSFALHGHTSNTCCVERFGHTSPVERGRALHAPLASSARALAVHVTRRANACIEYTTRVERIHALRTPLLWARLESHRAKRGTEYPRRSRERRPPASRYGPAFTAPVASRRRSPDP
jgi:hypothetical protein